MRKSSRWCSLAVVLLAVGCARGPSRDEVRAAPPNAAAIEETTETIGPPEQWDTTDFLAEAGTRAVAAAAGSSDVTQDLLTEYETERPEAAQSIRDPIKPWNVAWFQFNNKVYLWVVRPVAIGYRYVLYPRVVRKGIGHFIDNLGFPGRFLNSLLQAKFGGAGRELTRFLTNTTIGVLGFWDAATKLFHIAPQEEDFGQTLGVWGLPPMVYITWPIIGPSSIRDTLGGVGDSVLNPIVETWAVSMLAWINSVSLDPDELKNFLETAFNPYAAVRNAYVQNRAQAIEE